MNTRYTELTNWFRAEYQRRTMAIENGTGRVDWLDCGTRVSWSEIVSKARDLGITDDVVTMRQRFRT